MPTHVPHDAVVAPELGDNVAREEVVDVHAVGAGQAREGPAQPDPSEDEADALIQIRKFFYYI